MARSTGNLCEAANQAVQGEASEEKLVTSAKQVASSTAQLLVACKVKADPNSENMKRLQVNLFAYCLRYGWICTFTLTHEVRKTDMTVSLQCTHISLEDKNPEKISWHFWGVGE